MRCTKLATAVVLVALAAVLTSACGGGEASTIPEPTTAPPPQTISTISSQINKPKPIVVAVDSNTAGMFDNYYAILDITIANEGADGMLIVVGSITQGIETIENEMPVYLARDTTQAVKMVFPLTWKGGSWTPSVQTMVP